MKKRNCVYCTREFTPKGLEKTCSKICSNKRKKEVMQASATYSEDRGLLRNVVFGNCDDCGIKFVPNALSKTLCHWCLYPNRVVVARDVNWIEG